jgi:predicted TIM-barrel fold metal-dependent hydrolase
MKIEAAGLPENACDCHTHVVGDPARYPMVEHRPYTPEAAPHEALLAHLQRIGLQRVVLVQPSFYGSDNRCMLDSLERLGGAGRGVAVMDDDPTDAALARLHERGVRALRINVESTGIRSAGDLEQPLRRWAHRLAPLGWHLQLYASSDTVAQLADLLEGLPVPVVLDHFALLPAGAESDDAHDAPRERVLDLLADGNVYVKLSAPYRIATTETVAAATGLAQAFIAANAQRILWGSDWPHTNREAGKTAHEASRFREIPPATLVDSISVWLPAESLRRQVLVDNPARLYDF